MSENPPTDFSSIEQKAYDWVVKFAGGKASEADLAGLQGWLAKSPVHRKVFEQINRTWDGLGASGLELSPEDLLSQEEEGQDQLTARASAILGRRAVLGGVLTASAAGVAALALVRPPLGLWPSWSELHADYRTATGQQRHVVLADGVSIAMNTRTSIALQHGTNDSARIELISGEAMITTSQAVSSSCIVVAAASRIVATDARFNVWYDDQSVCVTCLNGAVLVEHGATKLPLSPNQQVVYSDGEIGPATAADPQIVTSWLQGVVIFRLTPISQVVEEVNRYRPGRVILTNAALGRRLMNARFHIQDIDGVVGQIQQVFGAHVTNLPGGVVLLG